MCVCVYIYILVRKQIVIFNINKFCWVEGYLVVSVGRPMDVTLMAEPTDKEVDDLHSAYVRRLEELFEANKLKYGVSEDQHLSVLWQ